MSLLDNVKGTLKPKEKKLFSSRSVARATAIQGVFMGNTPYASCLAKFLDPIIQSGVHPLFCDDIFYPLDTHFLQTIVSGVETHKTFLDQVIETGLSRSRSVLTLEEVTRSILLCGSWELKYASENPAPVILYEYVHWAKYFLSEGGYGFVHGVLDKIRPLLREEEQNNSKTVLV
ncbi:transcription antitermination factor NusB [Holospora curviuscula]|uniref:NusB/RsmB/TIM44 domain-containing protein n=1 Tax=Holospora curviuscula TaxID=1082868 RepID=A0A2S5R7H9_9PROT|nr:transcription antitermination factor NusB [Holospora curviuscula]PPE03299.1 hypothetical protein HCUR_01254 [Holospora curviuscula]